MGKPQILKEAKQYSCTLRVCDQLGPQEQELLTQVSKNTRLSTRKASVYSTFTIQKSHLFTENTHKRSVFHLI